MPDNKERRWYPFGTPEWWKGFGRKEAQTWKDIGRYTWGMMGGGFPWGVPGRVAPEFAQPTLRAMRPEEAARLRAQPTIRQKYGYAPITPEFLTEEIFPGESEAQRARQAAYGLLEPEKLDLYSQIMKAAGALRRTPEEIEANLREQLLESGVLTDENANLEKILRTMPYQGLAAYYAQLRTEYGRLPVEEREPTDIERQQLWQTQGWTKIPLTGEGGGYQWEAPIGIPPGWSGSFLISGAARKQQQASELVNKIQSWASQAFNQATTPEEVGAIETQAREALAANEGLFSQLGQLYGEVHQGLAFQGNQAMQNVLRMQGQLLSSEYPKWWQEYTQKTLAPTREVGVFISPPAEQAGFADWATRQPKFKEEQRAKEIEWYTQYPQLYPEYKKAPIQERMGGFLPWIEKTPWAKAYQNLQEPRYGAVRTPKWATARQRM